EWRVREEERVAEYGADFRGHDLSVPMILLLPFFFSSRRRHTRSYGDWSSDVCSSDLLLVSPSPGLLISLSPLLPCFWVAAAPAPGTDAAPTTGGDTVSSNSGAAPPTATTDRKSVV